MEQVNKLIDDLIGLSIDCGVVLTINTIESQLIKSCNPIDVKIISNEQIKGFSENHNFAALEINEEFLCVINPDVRLVSDPFPALLRLMSDPNIGLVVPRVTDSSNAVQDNVRRFPTLLSLARRIFLLDKNDCIYNVSSPIPVDWGAGMFMLFRMDAFRKIGGFDSKYFLYCEDIDICARLWRAGWRVVYDPTTVVIHDAQRTSRRNPIYLKWHIVSMARYFYKHWRWVLRFRVKD